MTKKSTTQTVIMIKPLSNAHSAKKMEKYEPLRAACETQFGIKTHLTIIAISSLGTVHPESQSAIKSLLKYGRSQHQNRELKRVTRRLSTAAILGSYLTFYKIGRKDRGNIELTNDAHGNVDMEEPDLNTSINENQYQ